MSRENFDEFKEYIFKELPTREIAKREKRKFETILDMTFSSEEIVGKSRNNEILSQHHKSIDDKVKLREEIEGKVLEILALNYEGIMSEDEVKNAGIQESIRKKSAELLEKLGCSEFLASQIVRNDEMRFKIIDNLESICADKNLEIYENRISTKLYENCGREYINIEILNPNEAILLTSKDNLEDISVWMKHITLDNESELVERDMSIYKCKEQFSLSNDDEFITSLKSEFQNNSISELERDDEFQMN